MKVIISGGGTGGHIFPAIAIANALKAADSSCEILFVGAEGKIEMEKVPAAGYKIIGLPVAGLIRKLTLKNIEVITKLMKSIRKSKQIIRSFQPDVAVGVGGYASAPLLFAASRKKIPIVIQEQNSYAGLTNKLLAKFANKICVAYDDMERYFPKQKILKTGNPVRKDLLNLDENKSEALKYFGLQANKPTILVVGGSGGARTINQAIIKKINEIAKENVQLVWQTGKFYYDAMAEQSKGINTENIKIMPFISRMDYAFSVADVVISRAGAATISELSLVAKPAILVPSPNVAEDHQTKNAMALVKNNAALLVTDAEAEETLIKQTFDLIQNSELQKTLSQNITKMALTDSAEKIADEIMKAVRAK